MKKEKDFIKRLLITLGILILINFIAIKASAQLTHSGNFIHLGAVEGNEELAFVKQQIATNQEPWTSEFNELLTWAVAGNLANVGPGENGPRDLCKNAYANALAWHYTGNVVYANRAVAILNAWANNFTGYASTAGQDLLVGGWIGTLLGPTAELMRNYPGWTAADQAKMKAMFVARFYPVINTMSTWNGNVDLTQIQAMLAIAVYNEDVAEFNAGLARLERRNPAYYYLSTDSPASRNYGGSSDAAWGSGSAVTAWVDGLTQETCRDNGHHAQFAMAATLAAAEIAWHQGVDVYAREEKRYVAVLELMAKQLTSGTMQGTCANNVTNPDRYNTFEIGYNHYHNRVGLDMIETQKILATSATSACDWNIFFETLTHRGTGSIISACTKPNLGPNQSICGKSSIILNTGLTANPRTFVWYRDNVVITTATSPTLTITQAGTYKVDVDSLGCKTTASVVISNTLTAAANASYELCNPVQQTLDAGNGGGATVTYLWNTGATTQSIVATKAGTYTATISATSCTPVSSTFTVTSKLLTVTGDTICAPGLANLSVTGTSTYSWFDVATNGTALATTKTYQPTISASKTFYVEDQGTVSATVGKVTAGTGATWTAGVADFAATDKIYNVTVSQEVTLNSIAVYVVNAGTNVTINFKQGAVTKYTATVTGLAAGKQTIPLNFNLLPGTYVIDAVGTTNGLSFEASGGTFPYSYPNYLSFTYNQTWQSTWYGLFYDWKISVGNTCLRTPVAAIINNTRPSCTGKPAAQTITGPTTVTANQQNVTYSVNPTIGSTFQWTLPAGATLVSANATNNQITVSFGTTGGTLSVIETNASGSTTNSITIIMSATCTATITSPTTSFCTGGSVLLSANTGTGFTYQWSNATGIITGATSATYTATAAGAYTVAVTNATACSATSAVRTITVNALPTATITSPTTSFCTGGSVLLSANTGTGFTYQWSNATGIITGATSAIYTATAAGAYTVSVTNATACSATSAVRTITVNALPTATVTSATTAFCTGGSVLLSANTGTGLTYQWSNASGIITGATNATYTATAAGAYSVAVTNTTACSATSAAKTITVNALPTATITSATTSFCTGGSILLSANTGTGLTYQWSNATGIITGATSATYTATAAGAYSVAVTNTTACSATSAARTITVNTIPTATISSATTAFCTGGSILLSANTGTGLTYQWSNASGIITGATNATYTATAAGAYTVAITNANACSATSAVRTITVNTIPTATISSPTTSFCTGGSILLSANTGTGLTYQWSNASGIITGATNATYTATAAGAYTVAITNATACSATSAARTITVNAIPTATITSPTTAFCTGGSILLSANTGTGLTYQWSNATGIIAGATNATYTATAAGAYTVAITNATACSATSAARTITVNTIPTATISSPTTSFCTGGSILLSANTGTGLTYQWSTATGIITGATSATYTATIAGAYTVAITNATACSATSAARTIIVNAIPTATITSPTTAFCTGGSVLLSANTGTGLTYQWSNATGIITGATNATYSATAASSYTVAVTNSNACSSTSVASVITTSQSLTWYEDVDGDGKGNPIVSINSCTQPSGYVLDAGDVCPNDPNKIAAGNCGCGNTESSCLDCAGVPNGTAFYDNCSICVGGTTGNTACVSTATINGTSVNISVKPQPFQSQTTIELTNYGKIQSITIFNAAGSLIDQIQNVNNSEITLGESLSSGMYTVIIQTENEIFTTKIVKY